MSDRVYIAEGRQLLALVVASGVVISAWAVFPSFVESRIYVPLPEASAPSAAEVIKARYHVVGRPLAAYAAFNTELVSSTPTVKRSVAVGNSSPVVDVSLVPLRSKLKALLLLLYQSDDVDRPALEAKIQALLKLPDSVLAQVMQHPDLADLTKMLDAVFLGKSDVSGVKTELDKIDVTSVPGTSDQIHVIKISGKQAYTVSTPAGEEGVGNSATSPEPAPPPGEPVTLASQFDPLAGLVMTTFALTPTSEEPPPPPPPPPTQARLFAPALVLAPSSEELPPPPPPTSEAPKALTTEPTDIPQTSADVINSGNKFEPGETVTQQSVDNSPPTNTVATQTESPSSSAPSPAEPGGVTGSGGEPSPGGGNDGATTSESGTGP